MAVRHVQVATADQAAERLVESQQIIPVECGRGRQVVQRHEVRQRDLVVRQWRVAFDRPEIRLRVALDLDGRQQLGIEIPRSEAERPSVVTPNDLGDVACPQPPHRTFHPRPAVVVSGHGQRPGFQRGIIILEQSRRGPRGQQWVAAFVHDVVDGQIQPAGGRNELPHPSGARLGIRVHVERRLDERQTGQFDRQPLLTKDPFDLRQVAARYAETLTKPLAHPRLRAQTPARRGLAEFVPLVDVREHRANLPFTTAEPPPLRTVPMQIAQRSPNLLDLPLDPRRPHPARLGLRVLVVQRLEIQDRVHLVQVHRIVDDGLISGVFPEDVPPEFDLRSQRLGIGQRPERPPGCRIARRLRRTEYECRTRRKKKEDAQEQARPLAMLLGLHHHPPPSPHSNLHHGQRGSTARDSPDGMFSLTNLPSEFNAPTPQIASHLAVREHIPFISPCALLVSLSTPVERLKGRSMLLFPFQRELHTKGSRTFCDTLRHGPTLRQAQRPSSRHRKFRNFPQSSVRCAYGVLSLSKGRRIETNIKGTTTLTRGPGLSTGSSTFPASPLSSLSLSKRTPLSSRPSPPGPLTIRILLYVILPAFHRSHRRQVAPPELGLSDEMHQRKSEVVIHLPPRLGDNLRADAQQAGRAQLLVLAVVGDVHVHHGVVVEARPYVDPDDLDLGEAGFEGRLDDLADLLLVHAGHPPMTVA